MQTLFERGFASEAALERAETEARSGRDVAASAAAALRAAQAALMGPDAAERGAMTVTAPVSGVVTRIFEESERVIPAGAPLVELGRSDGLEAAIEFLSEDAVKIAEGMPARIEDWGGPPVPAVVRRVEPQGFTKFSALGVEEQRVLVLLEGEEMIPEALGPGYRVWGRVFLRTQADAVKVPLGALTRAAGGWAVFVIEGGRARPRPIEVGAMTADEAEVVSGLGRELINGIHDRREQ